MTRPLIRQRVFHFKNTRPIDPNLTPFAGWRAEFINFALAGDRTIIKLNPPLEKGTDRRDFNHSPTGHSRTIGPNE